MIHYENGLPILLEQRYINTELVPEFYEQDFSLITPSGFLLANYELSEMEHTIDAIAATDEIAHHLQLSLGDPCLYISRRTWCKKELISFAHFTASGSRYKLYSRLNM
jgi:GntR family histidine utilization transcriptional repressor